MNAPLPRETWRHFKGQEYLIVVVAKHSETGEELVIYRRDDEDASMTGAWARPLAMFLEPATVKPTPPDNPNCQHPAESHYLDTIEAEDFMFCRDCEKQAAKGRFCRTMRGDGAIPPEAQKR